MTTDGGEGFSNSDVGENQLEKLIAATCEALAYTINTQVIPQWVIDRYGEDALARAPVVGWDATPPQDAKKSAEALKAFGEGITTANAGLAPYGKRIDAIALAQQNGYPLVDVAAREEGVPLEDLQDQLDDELDADDVAAGVVAAPGEEEDLEEADQAIAAVIDIKSRRVAA